MAAGRGGRSLPAALATPLSTSCLCAWGRGSPEPTLSLGLAGGSGAGADLTHTTASWALCRGWVPRGGVSQSRPAADSP